MKLLLLHGAGITSSRNKLNELKKNFEEGSLVIFEEGSNPQDINNNLVSTQLFYDERLIILENPPVDFIGYTINPNPVTLLLWFDREIDNKKPVIEWAKKINGQILYFPENKEVSVFPLLDLLAEGNKKAYLELEKLKKADFDTQYFIVMIFYLLRNLVVTSKSAKDFVKNKNARLRVNFPTERITKLYRAILDIDFKLKKGLVENSQGEFSLVDLFTH